LFGRLSIIRFVAPIPSLSYVAFRCHRYLPLASGFALNGYVVRRSPSDGVSIVPDGTLILLPETV
jgi:hypothetical protein